MTDSFNGVLLFRDFLRAISRLVPTLTNDPLSVPDVIPLFHELNDTWVMNLSREEFRRDAAKLLGNQLSLADDKIDHFFDNYAPEVGEEGESTLKVGRTEIPVKFHNQE